MAARTFIFGGLWWFFGGALVLALALYAFFIAPILGTAYVINIATILSLAAPIPILIFLAIWFALAFLPMAARFYKHKRNRIS